MFLQGAQSLPSTSSLPPDKALSAPESPRFIQVFSASDKVQQEDNVFVHCSLINSQKDPCKIGGKAMWFLNTNAVYISEHYKIFLNNTLQVVAIKLTDTGKYECRWRCHDGSIKDSGHFHIQVTSKR